MSNNRSTVLGESVKAGEVDSDKIDGATGRFQFPILVANHEQQVIIFVIYCRHEHCSCY